MKDNRFQRITAYNDKFRVSYRDIYRSLEFRLQRLTDNSLQTHEFLLCIFPLSPNDGPVFVERWSYDQTPDLFVYRWRFNEVISLICDHPLNQMSVTDTPESIEKKMQSVQKVLSSFNRHFGGGQ